MYHYNVIHISVKYGPFKIFRDTFETTLKYAWNLFDITIKGGIFFRVAGHSKTFRKGLNSKERGHS